MNNVAYQKNLGEQYKVGDTILIHITGRYVPAMISQVNPGMIAVISLDDGNRWTAPVSVHDIRDIDYQTIFECTGNNKFELLKSVTITRGK